MLNRITPAAMKSGMAVKVSGFKTFAARPILQAMGLRFNKRFSYWEGAVCDRDGALAARLEKYSGGLNITVEE
jgi:hypothetical protein